tara:strand:- start:9 stop:785 length:777 start_codon:yes stop_codon:yes gene_type:complete
MKKIILFDVDGTLTPPREIIEDFMIDKLIELQKFNFDIGLVTGSDLNYLKEQCQPLFESTEFFSQRVHYLPCNGTKYYKLNQYSVFQKIYSLSMREHINKELYEELIWFLMDCQIKCKYLIENNTLPVSGTFIQYRGSMINWCPIGRSATKEDRNTWTLLDQKYHIRDKFLEFFSRHFHANNIVIKFGGETSFDIYPVGWDKTYAFKNFKDYNEIYFVGDRCTPTGNDYEAYKMAKEKGFKTSGPIQTKNIITKILHS